MAQTSTGDLPRIGDVIRAWRIFRGLRSTELAARAGVRSQYLSEIEHNRTKNPKEDYLQKLADALEVPLKDILGRQMPRLAGAFGSGVGLDTIPSRSRTPQQQTETDSKQRDPNISFLAELKQIVSEIQLTPEKRILAERLILENARSVYEVLAKEQDQERR
jgi:transcriptional regulator with XRE-family HTH domain